jgi:hypothetical protein
MSGDLFVGSGGVVMVSDGLLEAVHRLDSAATELGRQHAVVQGHIEEWRLAGIQRSAEAHRALATMEGASDLLKGAHHRAHTLVGTLRHSIAIYETAEKIARGVMDFAHEAEAWELGVAARVFGVPIAVGLGADVALACLLTGKTPAKLAASAGDFMMKNPSVITTPAFVNGVAGVVDNTDQFEDGFLGVPPGLSQLLGPLGLGLTGPATAAASVVGLGSRFGMVKETPVEVHQERVRDNAAPPVSLAGRYANIPSVSPGQPAQFRIMKYVEAGKPDRFDVFIGGTASFDPHAKAQPFDLTSDLNGVAQLDPAMYRGLVTALHDAGVTSHSPIVFTGYSGGGLGAALLAASGHYDVKGLVVVGSPSGQIRIPDSIPMLTIKNTDDPVPATGGFDINSHAIVIEHRAYGPGDHIPTDKPVPAHQRVAYQETARLADASADPRLKRELAQLKNFGDGATSVESTLWVARRGN